MNIQVLDPVFGPAGTILPLGAIIALPAGQAVNLISSSRVIQVADTATPTHNPDGTPIVSGS